MWQRRSSILAPSAVGWTLLLAALEATALTTKGLRSDQDGELPWLPFALPAIWLGGVVLLALACHVLRRQAGNPHFDPARPPKQVAGSSRSQVVAGDVPLRDSLR